MNFLFGGRNQRTHVSRGEEESQRRLDTCYGGVWSDRDREMLKINLIDYLTKPLKWDSKAADAFNPDARGLLCARRDEVYDRSITYFSSLNIMSGLMIAALAGSVLNPYDVAKIEPEKRIYAEIFNLCGVVVFFSEYIVCIFSFFIMSGLASNMVSSSMVYRSILRIAPHLSGFFALFWMPSLLIPVMILTSQLICNRRVASYIAIGLVTLLFVGTYHMMSSFDGGMEQLDWNQLPQMAPWQYYFSGRKHLVEDAERQHRVMLAEAQKSILEVVQDDSKYVHNGTDSDLSEAKDEKEMLLLLDAALPELNSDHMRSRKDALSTSLLRNGLTVERLKAAASLSNGIQLVDGKLAAHPELTQGQALGLTTYIISNLV